MLVLFNLGRVCSNISGSEQKTAFFFKQLRAPNMRKRSVLTEKQHRRKADSYYEPGGNAAQPSPPKLTEKHSKDSLPTTIFQGLCQM